MNNQGQVSESLGSTLRSLRQQHGLTLQEMAEKTGLSAGFLSKIERGASQPTINNLQKILGVTSGGITDDGKFSLQDCRCIGACGLAPVMTVNDDVYGRLTGDEKELRDILAKYE